MKKVFAYIRFANESCFRKEPPRKPSRAEIIEIIKSVEILNPKRCVYDRCSRLLCEARGIK